MTATPLKLIVIALAAAALSGCALLGGGEKANLYRFGQAATPDALQAPTGTVGVFRANGVFQRESAGDRLLTVTGGKVAYIAETRWVAPAATLFNQSLLAAFDADPGPVRIVSRGEPARADYVLRVDVRNFETVYENGSGAAPVVLVRLRASLTTDSSRALVAEELFESRTPAASNRVSAIVQAYDQATNEVLTQVVAWTNQRARPSA